MYHKLVTLILPGGRQRSCGRAMAAIFADHAAVGQMIMDVDEMKRYRISAVDLDEQRNGTITLSDVAETVTIRDEVHNASGYELAADLLRYSPPYQKTLSDFRYADVASPTLTYSLSLKKDVSEHDHSGSVYVVTNGQQGGFAPFAGLDEAIDGEARKMIEGIISTMVDLERTPRPRNPWNQN